MDTVEQPVVSAAPPPRTATRSSPRPTHRAPLWLRVFLATATVAAGLSTVALLLSDRAPGVLRSLFGDAARRLWARVDADRRAAIEATGATTQTDLFVHVAIWLVVTLLLALTLWTWRGVAIAVVVAGAASVVLEFGQRRWATTRAFEVSDLMANLVGVVLGAVAALVIVGVWAAIGDWLARRRATA